MRRQIKNQSVYHSIKNCITQTKTTYCNPLIAAAFFRSGYIETWGRGIEKIMDECNMANAPIPEFNNDFAGLMVIFDAGTIENLKEPQEEPGEKGSEKIIELIEANNFITISELAKFLGVTTRTIERKIKKLQSENKIRRVGSDKTGHWILS